MSKSKIEIRVGQVWEDQDSRMRGRRGTVVEIDESAERALINWSGRKSRVSFKRLRRPSQYALVSDPKAPAAPENLKPFRIDCELDEMVGSQRSYAGSFTMSAWAFSYKDAEKLFFDYVKENGKMLSGPDEDCSYQIHDVEIKRSVEVWSGIMTGSK